MVSGIGRSGLGGARLADASGGSVCTTAYSERGARAAGGEWPVAGAQMEQQHAQRIDVAGRHGRVAGDLFWRGVF